MGEGAVEALPVDRVAAAVEFGEAAQQHLPVIKAGAQARPPRIATAGGAGASARSNGVAIGRASLQALAAHAEQSGFGAQLHKGNGPLGHQGGHALGEVHRAQHVVAPVVALGDLGTGQLTGHVAHQGPAGGREADLAQHLLEGLEHRRHRR